MPNNEIKYVDLYYDHYKDTFEQIKGYIKRRNNCTIIILCLVILFLFQVDSPNLVNSIILAVVNKYIGNVIVEFEYIKPILYLTLLWVLATYYRTTLTIERQYSYIHGVEDSLSEAMKPFRIEREGKNYLKDDSFFLKLINTFYKITLPVSISFFAIFDWIYEKNNTVNSSLFWFNTLLLFCISIIPLLYFFHIHKNDLKGIITKILTCKKRKSRA